MRALVIGGNYGGLSAALALRQAGHDVQVFERFDGPEVLQSSIFGIHLWTNAMRALRVIEAEEAAHAAGDEVDVFEFRSWRTGRLLTEWSLADIARDYGAPTVLIDRAALHRVLLDALGVDSVAFGAACVGYEQDGDGVTARFKDGREERGDLLVAADGMGSVIRPGVVGETDRRFMNTLWRGRTEHQHGKVPPRTMWSVWGPGLRVLVNQIDDRRVSWFMVSGERSEDKTIDKQALLARVRGWAEPVEEVIEHTDEERMERFEIFDREPVDRWVDGRVALLGDAAHPMINTYAQGACQAFEDAAVLKLEFGDGASSANDVPSALASWERRRIPRANDQVKRAWTFGKIGLWKNPLAWRFRDRLITATRQRALKQFRDDMSYEF